MTLTLVEKFFRNCIFAMVLAPWHSLFAQSFPTKPLQLVIPSAPGAAYDLIGRVLADGARDALGSIIVDNRPGGNFTIGAAYVKRAPPDGHTVLLSGNAHVIGEALDLPRSYNLFQDFEAVGHLTDLPFYLTVHSESVPVGSLKEFVQFVKARPGKLVYFTPGNGALHHFAMESLKIEAGLDILHVPYKAMAQGVTDFLGGRVNMTITGFPAIAPHVATGKFKMLANVGARRSSFQPDIPTFAEAGVPGVELVSWFGIVAPAATPRPIINRLNSEFNRALQRPEVREKFKQQGLDIGGGTPEEMAARLRRDFERYVKIVKATGMKPD
ncbi:MAG: Bug family tripartite tricarboxylate transporter substrate binding protein [Burkholderiales bacterium]